MTKFTVLALEPGDIDAVCSIQTECRLSAWSRAAYLRELHRSDAIILKSEGESGQINGFIAGRAVPGMGPGGLDAEIYNIGVYPAFQDQGAGSQLFHGFIRRCKELGVSSVWLEVRESNSKAIRFYSGKGFRRQGLRKEFYRDPVEDAVMMCLTLGSEALQESGQGA